VGTGIVNQLNYRDLPPFPPPKSMNEHVCFEVWHFVANFKILLLFFFLLKPNDPKNYYYYYNYYYILKF